MTSIRDERASSSSAACTAVAPEVRAAVGAGGAEAGAGDAADDSGNVVVGRADHTAREAGGNTAAIPVLKAPLAQSAASADAIPADSRTALRAEGAGRAADFAFACAAWAEPRATAIGPGYRARLPGHLAAATGDGVAHLTRRAVHHALTGLAFALFAVLLAVFPLAVALLACLARAALGFAIAGLGLNRIVRTG